MNYKEAFEILEIDYLEIKYNDLTLDYLKKQYKKMALKHHPDKNGNTDDSTEHFKKINEAYNYLKRELKNLNPEDFACENSDDDINEQFSYFIVLKNFIKSVFESKYSDIKTKIINEILIAGKQISLKIFEDLDKDTVLVIFNFLSRYRFILHINNDLLDKVREIVVSKYDNVEIYKLNPSITDLLECNFYKLYIENQLYLVPLWHYETCYDGSGCEIIVICEPELPEGIQIDDDNNLYVETKISICHDLPDMLANNLDISLDIGEKNFYIPLSNLYLKKEQYYRFKNQGITKVKNDLYDVKDKSDIIVKIKFI
jgi:curved DNA-binding protein CbpA